MFARALFAFIALPGVFAFGVPLAWAWMSHRAMPRDGFGLLPLLFGVVGLLWCVWDFYFAGKGTLAPWSPPRRLVVVGLYRYSRNPMYVSVVMVLLGWAILFRSEFLFIYAAAVATAFHLRVVLGEEPWLRRTHGAEWEDYVSRVRRWW